MRGDDVPAGMSSKMYVSIHAPRMRGDCDSAHSIACSGVFQSTPLA